MSGIGLKEFQLFQNLTVFPSNSAPGTRRGAIGHSRVAKDLHEGDYKRNPHGLLLQVTSDFSSRVSLPTRDGDGDVG